VVVVVAGAVPAAAIAAAASPPATGTARRLKSRALPNFPARSGPNPGSAGLEFP
jgi:hypothetical protein